MSLNNQVKLLLNFFIVAIVSYGVQAIAHNRNNLPHYTILEVADSPYTTVFSINNKSQIAGNYASSDELTTYTFVYSKGIYHTLTNPPEIMVTQPWGINDRGQIVGEYADIDFNPHGFLYDKGTYKMIEYPSPAVPGSTQPEDINNHSQIVGNYGDSNGFRHGFVYFSGTYKPFDIPGARDTGLSGINDRGQIVGHYDILNSDLDLVFYSFAYDKGHFTFFKHPSSVNGTIARAINNSGQVVGYYFDDTFTGHGFLYDKGVYTTLDVPGAVRGTFPLGINDRGEVVGYFNDAFFKQRGFLLKH